MKKITFLAICLFSVSTYAQNDETAYSMNSTTSQTNNTPTEAIITRSSSNSQVVVDTYTSLTDFNTGIADCDDSTITSEVFTGGPAAITVCGPSISDAGDSCFPAAEIEAGFTTTSSELSNQASVVNIPAGSLANNSSLIGATTFAEFTIINFDTPIYAAAFDIYNNLDATTNVRIYGTGGNLIEDFAVNTPIDVETFFGFYTDEEVISIEIEGAAESGELFGNFLFGAECSNLSIEGQTLVNASAFPNPTKGTITLTTHSSVQINSISILDITGKEVMKQLNTNSVNLGNLANGLYLITAKTTAGIFTQKVVKQ